MCEFEDMRNEIDKIDTDIQRLFERRLDVSRKIGSYKASHGMQVFDPKREDEMIRRMRERAGDAVKADAVEELYRTILKISRDLQKEVLEHGSDDICRD